MEEQIMFYHIVKVKNINKMIWDVLLKNDTKK